MKFTQGITVDGVHYDIPLVSVTRNADFLDKYANRVESGDLERELIGVFYNFTLTVGSSTAFGDGMDYETFYMHMTEPVDYHTVSLPVPGGTYVFVAYISSVSDQYEKVLADDVTIKTFSCKFTAKSPARVPS